ncbi:unnamed protein product, partial [Amoebophrya sp. A120]|eukprot:GSA120T00013199001.1
MARTSKVLLHQMRGGPLVVQFLVVLLAHGDLIPAVRGYFLLDLKGTSGGGPGHEEQQVDVDHELQDPTPE